MLVLKRGADESVMIGDDVEVMVTEVRGDKVKLGFIAPIGVLVYRKEVWLRIKREQREQAEAKPADAPPAFDGNQLDDDNLDGA
jgi:carbon storage regulator